MRTVENRPKHHCSRRPRALPPDAEDCRRVQHLCNRHGEVPAPGSARSREIRALPRWPSAIRPCRLPRRPRSPGRRPGPAQSLPGKERNFALYSSKPNPTIFFFSNLRDQPPRPYSISKSVRLPNKLVFNNLPTIPRPPYSLSKAVKQQGPIPLNLIKTSS